MNERENAFTYTAFFPRVTCKTSTGKAVRQISACCSILAWT